MPFPILSHYYNYPLPFGLPFLNLFSLPFPCYFFLPYPLPFPLISLTFLYYHSPSPVFKTSLHCLLLGHQELEVPLYKARGYSNPVRNPD